MNAAGVRFRPMSMADYAGMTALWHSCDGLLLRDADGPDGIEKYLRRNPGTSFVALDAGDSVVGTIMAGHDGRRGYIMHVAVSAELRRRGIASRLLALCLEALRREGIVKAHVHVAGSNREGRDYWRRRGFHHRGEIELYSRVDGDNENA